MISIDFFNTNKEVQLSAFCDYFRLNKDEVLKFLKANDSITASRFAYEFKLNLSEYKSNQIQIICRHMTTATDIKNFQLRGLLDLKTMLTTETPLSQFLLNHGVVVRVNDGVLDVCGESYSIKNATATFGGSQFENSMGNLCSKLYHFNATVEFFINATLDEMHGYQRIDRHPEILETLDWIIHEIPNKKPEIHLCNDWAAINKKCYLLEFAVRLSEMETFAPIFWNEAYDDYSECFELSGYSYDDYVERSIPQSILDNVDFLRRFLRIYFGNECEFGSFLPNGSISASRIKFIEIH